jgi:hypothetical protein
MKVKIIKDGLSIPKGEIVDVSDSKAKYWEKIGVAKPNKKGKQSDDGLKETVVALEEVSKIDVDNDGVIGDPGKEKSEVEQKKEKNEKAGPNAPKKK